MDPYAWSWNPEALLLVAAMTVAYFWALRRVPAPGWRIGCWLAAMALLLAVTITPIETISLNFLLSVHLIQNVVLAEWAPLLVVLAIPPALAARAPRVPPLPALVLWAVNYGIWHLPWIYDGALRHPHSLLHLEHALYFLTGLALWWPVVHGGLTSGAKAAYVFGAFLLASPIGLMMALVPDPIYDFYADAPRLWGLSPILDQQIAGVSMAAAEAVVFFAVFAFFFARFFAEQDAAA
ncbi:MAG TPA: cytochrome c oxidase assembly protein [Gaiellaceae bacterium]|nr:cytochrome c oxidase assembly protein [Gaiellaceae bacterium]